MALSKALFVFILHLLTNNYSQVDKLWSIMPVVYSWTMVGLNPPNTRLTLAASIVTIWGIRLTYNFGRKGGYSIKFWTGEEDYRWLVLRNRISNPIVWFVFNVCFISIYQSLLIMGFTLPLVLTIDNNTEINYLD
mmetsp:Transcript_115814/g.248864  ORF Transcript_115814/g.248864 Transcript_115814/m.248864 type:complete len:135 (-) Transcript_115814:647-1051(-)